MGSEQSHAQLCAFLSAVQQDAGYPPLKEVSILNPFNLKQSLTDKTSIIDVRAEDEAGDRVPIARKGPTRREARGTGATTQAALQ
jgi:hypothetical protein